MRLGVANVVMAAPSPHPLRTGPGHPGPVRGGTGHWAGPSNTENGSEPLAGAFGIFIFILSRSQSQVGRAYGQGGLSGTGVKARIRTHFRM